MRDERKGFVMKRILSLLLCAALLLPCALSGAESAAFDGSVFAGKKGYTLREDGSWTCACGAVNNGKFCPQCGKPAPAPAEVKCGNCGWKPADGASAPKFCPECGTPFGA